MMVSPNQVSYTLSATAHGEKHLPSLLLALWPLLFHSVLGSWAQEIGGSLIQLVWTDLGSDCHLSEMMGRSKESGGFPKRTQNIIKQGEVHEVLKLTL